MLGIFEVWYSGTLCSANLKSVLVLPQYAGSMPSAQYIVATYQV